MAQVVNVNFKLDADIKKSMEEACSEMGISMSAAFKIFAKKVGREKRIPFEVSADPFYSESKLCKYRKYSGILMHGKIICTGKIMIILCLYFLVEVTMMIRTDVG